MNWTIRSRGYDAEDIDFLGNEFFMGNGFMGIRGSLDEYTAAQRPAINLAGVYDRHADAWRESVNAPNGLYLAVCVDGACCSLPWQEPLEHEQSLDFRHGIQRRRTVWQTERGTVSVESERFASMADCHLAAVRFTVKCSYTADLKIISGIDGEIWDINGPHFGRVELICSDDRLQADCTTGEKGTRVIVCEQTIPAFDCRDTIRCVDLRALREFEVRTIPGHAYTVDKTVMVTHSLDSVFSESPSLPDEGYDVLRRRHCARWEAIWEDAEFRIEGDPEAMRALNYSIYHLNCIAPRHSESLSIPARGLSGQVYKGAVFWDTEMFMFDYFLFTDPAVARTLIRYRIDTLPGALKKAESYGFRGAFYAWESQEDGSDACSDYNVIDVFSGRPQRTYFRDKQVHISAAVAYALLKYLRVTGDLSVMEEGGFEMLLECARFYYSLLLRRAGSEVYEIHDVVGPDEYHERVNNNAYTNRMAKFVLESAAEQLGLLLDKGMRQDAGGRLRDELERFRAAAVRLYIPHPGEDGVVEQFDGYFRLEDVRVGEVRSRLLHPKEYWGGAGGVASPTQVIKQADVVAMLGLFPEDYSQSIQLKNWQFYEPRTEHGSSLSACMYALVACRAGLTDAAYPLFMKSAQADMSRSNKLWAGLVYIGGTHPAASGGAWMVAVRGIAGLTVQDGRPICRPAMPSHWKRVSFCVRIQGVRYRIEAAGDKAVVTPLEKGRGRKAV